MSLRLKEVYGVAREVAPAKTFRRRFGVPGEGPFDRESFTLANAILGLPLDTPAWEILGGSAVVIADRRLAVACIGATTNQVVELQEGQSLEVGVKRPGNAFYITRSETAAAGKRLAEPPDSLEATTLRYLKNGEMDLPILTVNNASNRAGVRFDGLPAQPQEDLPSEPCCVGAMQLTPSGQLIVVGPSGPTIGGYPKVGYVIEADQDRLAHLSAGCQVCFEPVDWETALILVSKRDQRLRQKVEQIRLGIGM